MNINKMLSSNKNVSMMDDVSCHFIVYFVTNRYRRKPVRPGCILQNSQPDNTREPAPDLTGATHSRRTKTHPDARIHGKFDEPYFCMTGPSAHKTKTVGNSKILSLVQTR
jgi:hypothetical protein